VIEKLRGFTPTGGFNVIDTEAPHQEATPENLHPARVQRKQY
jgi:hypothetical protein